MSILIQKSGTDPIFSLTNKVAVVTGGAKGIGAATVRLFEKSGARVHVLDIESGCDVADEKQVEKAFAAIGGFDILVNNAGRALRRTALEVKKDEWDAVIELNLTRALALEWAPDNIRVNAVAPTYVRTDLTVPITGVTLPIDSGYLAR